LEKVLERTMNTEKEKAGSIGYGLVLDSSQKS
jgi:hypothetical protein